MENWVEVLEYNKKSEDRQKGLLELFNDEKIPHKEELKKICVGIGRRGEIYEQNIVVYVPKEYKVKAETYIKEYKNPKNILFDEAEEFQEVDIDEEEEFKLTKISKNILKYLFGGMLLVAIIGMIITSIIY